MELPATTSWSGLPETATTRKDGSNWPGQPHQEKAPHSVQGGHGAHRHKGGEERASGRGNRWRESWWQKTAKLKHKNKKFTCEHFNILKMNEMKKKKKKNMGYQSVQLHVWYLWFYDLLIYQLTLIHSSTIIYDNKKTEPEEKRQRNWKKHT